MTENLNNPENILFLAIGVSAVIIGILSQYSQKKRIDQTILIIPMRRLYFWLACFLVIVSALNNVYPSGFDITTVTLLIFSIGMALLFSSMDLLVLNDGIYCFFKFTPWKNITGISKDFMGLYFQTTTGIFKKIGYVNFVWKIQNQDIKKLRGINADTFK